jgi:hypothetical protein
VTSLLIAVFVIGAPLGAAALWVCQAFTARDLDHLDETSQEAAETLR